MSAKSGVSDFLGRVRTQAIVVAAQPALYVA